MGRSAETEGEAGSPEVAQGRGTTGARKPKLSLAAPFGGAPPAGEDQADEPVQREMLLAKTLVELTDMLVADFDAVDLLTWLAERCVELFGAAAAGFMLAGPDGELRVVASSSEAMRALELLELQSGHGPCIDCYRSGNAVGAQDLSLVAQRWPGFGAEALAAGYRSVQAVPLRLHGAVIGALDLFHIDPAQMRPADVDNAQALADVATIAVLQHRPWREAGLLDQQLQQALNSRVAVEQAKGIVADRAGVSMELAFVTLRAHARDNDLRLVDVAAAVIDGSLLLSELSLPTAAAGSLRHVRARRGGGT